MACSSSSGSRLWLPRLRAPTARFPPLSSLSIQPRCLQVLNEYYDSVEGQAELQTQMQTQVEYASVGQVSIDVAGPASAAAPRAAAVPAAAAGGGGEPRAAVADEGGEISPAQEQPEPAAAGDVVPAGGAPEKEEKEDKAD